MTTKQLIESMLFVFLHDNSFAKSSTAHQHHKGYGATYEKKRELITTVKTLKTKKDQIQQTIDNKALLKHKK